MIKITTNSVFLKILNFIKIGNQIHTSVITVEILKNAVSLIIKSSALKNITLIIKVKNNANITLMIL